MGKISTANGALVSHNDNSGKYHNHVQNEII